MAIKDAIGRFVEQPIAPRLESHTLVANCGYKTACWLWTGGTRESNRGVYGKIFYRGRNWRVHRLAYSLFVGDLIEGMVVDHLCKNTLCHNPAHLEQVTQRVNNERGSSPSAINARKTHCDHGHEFTPENTYMQSDGRRCRRCRRERRRAA